MYQEHDLLQIPQAVPELGIAEGDRGLVKDLSLRNETVMASVRIDYSTGQTRGWVEMMVRPEERIVSYSLGA